jgi:hypothetical protein
VYNILPYTYTYLLVLTSYLTNFGIGIYAISCGANLILILINLTNASHNTKVGLKVTLKTIIEICKADALC